MNVSVIVPTYNGATKLPVILRSLMNQTFTDFELIVAIDGSVDGSEAIAQTLLSNFNNAKTVSQPNGGRASIRNFGARQATGDLVVFFDDDMVVAPDCLARHIAHHKTHLESILGGNQVEDIRKNKTDIQNYKAWLTEQWLLKFQKGVQPLTATNFFLTAANMSVPRELFFRLDGFDQRLRDAEDFDFGSRALEMGIPVYFDYLAQAVHEDQITCASYIRST